MILKRFMTLALACMLALETPMMALASETLPVTAGSDVQDGSDTVIGSGNAGGIQDSRGNDSAGDSAVTEDGTAGDDAAGAEDSGKSDGVDNDVTDGETGEDNAMPEDGTPSDSAGAEEGADTISENDVSASDTEREPTKQPETAKQAVTLTTRNIRCTGVEFTAALAKKDGFQQETYINVYYREHGTEQWTGGGYFPCGEEECSFWLSDLKPGTDYEILVELKDTYNETAGEDVAGDAATAVTTETIDHILTAEPVTEEIGLTSVALDIQLTKPTGTLENRAKAVVTLTPESGKSQSKDVYLKQDNQYKERLVIDDLLPGMKYAVSAEFYESKGNTWTSLKKYELGEVTTKNAEKPVSIAFSEETLFLNKGISKKLALTVQPQGAAYRLSWSSSNTSVATVAQDGIVKANNTGETDIIVSGVTADSVLIKAVCHVTVHDYAIHVKAEDGTDGGSLAILNKAKKRTLTVYDNVAKADVPGATWKSGNPYIAGITDDGLLEPLNLGQVRITAKTPDGAVVTAELKVLNDKLGFSITRPEAGQGAYTAIRIAENEYQVAAGETYSVGCIISPAYTAEGYGTSVKLAGNRFAWSADQEGVTITPSTKDNALTAIAISETVSGKVKITSVMKDEGYQDKRFSITLDVLRKPEVTTIPGTYTWLDYSNKLASVDLPEHWQWKEKDTLLHEAGKKTFTARYTAPGYYPYETNVAVYAEKIGNMLSAKQLDADGKEIPSDQYYSTAKKAYLVRKGTPLKVKLSVPGQSVPTFLYEQSALSPLAKDAAKVSVSAPDGEGYYSISAFAKGTYTVSAVTTFKKAAFEEKDGAYALTAGAKVKDTTVSLKFMAIDTVPVRQIAFAVADDSPEKVTIDEDGTITYKVTAANADTKQNARVIHLDVTAKDADGNKVESPIIDYKVSDASIVKLKKDGTDRLILTVPKGVDGLAKIVATAKDELGYSAQLSVRVKDYTPRVTTQKITLNENYTYSKQIAQVVLPYNDESDDWVSTVYLVKTNTQGAADRVEGFNLWAYKIDSDDAHKWKILLSADKANVTKKGNLKYYLAIQTRTYGGFVYVPVQFTLEAGEPPVTVKQTRKVNVFYTDTAHKTSYDRMTMGYVEVNATMPISSVRWEAQSAGNTEFVINDWDYTSSKNGKYTKKFYIQQHRPVLDSRKKPSDAAVKGTLYVKLSGYDEEIAKPLTIQTVYQKPKLKVADYKVCPALGGTSDQQRIYTNAAKTGNWMYANHDVVWRGYGEIVCADKEVEVTGEEDLVTLKYTGAKDKKTRLTLYSDYWYEPLTVPVKIKVVKSKVKLSPAAVTLNAAYPSETTQTGAATKIYNAATGTEAGVSDVAIKGANAQAQRLLDQGMVNMDYRPVWTGGYSLSVSLNYAKAMGSNKVKPGSYKYKLTPYYGETRLNDVTLTVKVIDKEAAVTVRTQGAIDLLKLKWDGSSYSDLDSPGVTVTPAFRNVDSTYQVVRADLCGAYKDLFKIAETEDNGVLKLIPSSIGKLKAGKNYTLSVKYTVSDKGGGYSEYYITVTSNTFTIKPKQTVPKVTSTVKQFTLYASAAGESRGETATLSVPHTSKKGYYVIQDAGGSLDINKDGKADLVVTTTKVTETGGKADIRVYIQDADAVRATAKGVNYKIPVTVKCVGRDGVSRDASTTVSVVVKK